ncbi:MAG: DMT family transporter [Bacteroidota bacterium]
MTLSSSNFIKALTWFILSLVVSCGNDAIMKYIGVRLSPWQVAFFRCLFGTITLLPLMFYQRRGGMITQRPLLHLLRGGLLFVAVGLWNQGVQTSPITTATLMSFTIPIFVLIMAAILLQEQVVWSVWLATLLGFVGVVLVLKPEGNAWHLGSLSFVASAMLFSLLDIVNKKYVDQEPMLCMLFYPTLIATVLTAWPAWGAWQPPTPTEIAWLLVLGIGSNLILYFILRAFSLVNASVLAPFRYLELPLSASAGCILFQEFPSTHNYVGASIIIPCTLFVVYHQSRKA